MSCIRGCTVILIYIAHTPVYESASYIETILYYYYYTHDNLSRFLNVCIASIKRCMAPSVR